MNDELIIFFRVDIRILNVILFVKKQITILKADILAVKQGHFFISGSSQKVRQYVKICKDKLSSNLLLIIWYADDSSIDKANISLSSPDPLCVSVYVCALPTRSTHTLCDLALAVLTFV